jgi:hypothetical protein
MELALHFGMPADELSRRMTEAEFRKWQRYASRKALPFPRLEVLLAQVAMMVARMGGAKNVTVKDFMLQEPEELPDNVTHIDVARRAFGFNPRKKKV